MAKAKRPVQFEKALEQLESLVEKMEAGDLSLEESLKAFEKGVGLSRDCQAALSEAEQRVKTLVDLKDGDPELVDFDVKDED